MKLLPTICFSLVLSMNAFSQQTPEAFIVRIPAVPSEVCGINSAEIDAFSQKVEAISEQIKEAISKRRQEYKDFVGDNKDQMIQNMAGQSGLSAADMAKLKNGGQLSQAEAMALANKMMGQKYNMSVGEAKNVGKMNKEGQKAWAEAYGAEMMADAQANPNKYNNEQKKNKTMYELAAEQSELVQLFQAEESKLQTILDEINSKAASELIKLNAELEPLQEELNKLPDVLGVTAATEAKKYGLLMQMYNLRYKYCEKFTPPYLDLLNRNLIAVKTNLTKRYRLQELTDEMTAAQTGVQKGKITPDLMALDSISRYLNLLANLFRFYPGEKPSKH